MMTTLYVCLEADAISVVVRRDQKVVIPTLAPVYARCWMWQF